jgi:hypothetical protein
VDYDDERIILRMRMMEMMMWAEIQIEPDMYESGIISIWH